MKKKFNPKLTTLNLTSDAAAMVSFPVFSSILYSTGLYFVFRTVFTSPFFPWCVTTLLSFFFFLVGCDRPEPDHYYYVSVNDCLEELCAKPLCV